MTWKLEYTKRAEKDAALIFRAKLSDRAAKLLEIIEHNSFQNPPPYEKLSQDLRGMYSRRINVKHRLVYEIHKTRKTVRVLSLWSHYE
ncbi:MAG: Txe/YoeB family addiction module toxin [Pyrinomonadaceae bacterium]